MAGPVVIAAGRGGVRGVPVRREYSQRKQWQKYSLHGGVKHRLSPEQSDRLVRRS